MGERTYIAIDLKSFYASVECVERGLDPLTTNLVVADESRTSKTICLAVTPTLKAYGLSGRSRLFEVEAKAKEVQRSTGKELEYIVAPPRMGLYIEYSTKIYNTYLKYVSSEDIHVYSIDEVFMDVTSYLTLHGMDAKTLASVMINDVYSNTGITATAGIGENLYLAKIAMDIVAKHVRPNKDGVRIASLDMMEYRKKLWDYKPITAFWRMGRGTAKKLEKNGIYTMGDIARLSLKDEEWFFKNFGIDAEIMIDHAWGYEPCLISDIKAYVPKVTSLTSGQVLKEPYDFETARIVLREMTEALVLEMVDKGFSTDLLNLDIGFDRENVDSGSWKGEVKADYYGRVVPKPVHASVNLGGHTSLTSRIATAMMELYDRVTVRELTVRRLTICFGNLMAKAYEQHDIFDDPVKIENEKNMQKAMIDIRKKFGKNAILKGTDLQKGATMMERNEQIGGHKA